MTSNESRRTNTTMNNTIYYLPGHGGRLATGLGEALTARGFDIAGRETRDDFRALPFSEQVSLVANDLQTTFWNPDSRVIANSFGAYLFLHAQASMMPFPGRVLLLSPIVGEFADTSTDTFFSPPYPRKLRELAAAGSFPTPCDAQIHVGSEDWQSVPDNVKQFGIATGIPVTVVESAGHMLPKAYVGRLLDDWLTRVISR